MAKAEAKKQELTEVKNNVPAEYNAPASWGTEDLDAGDLLLPRMHLLQPLSEIPDGAKAGDIVNTVSKRVLAAKDKKAEVIIIKQFKNVTLSLGKKYGGTIPFNPIQHAQIRKYTDADGTEWNAFVTLNFFVLPADDLNAIPHVVQFKSTGFTTGRQLISFLEEMRRSGGNAASKTVKLFSVPKENDKGKFFVLQAETDGGRKTTAEEQKKAYEWYQTLSKSQFKVDESDLTDNVEVDVQVDVHSANAKF